jgi:hypothetical protein
VKLYEAQLTQGKTRMEVEVTHEGLICEVETEVATGQVPPATMAVLVKEAGGGKIQKIETQAQVKSGKVTKLETPRIAYEAKFVKGETMGKVEIDTTGNVLEKHQW